ncbi:DUF502 domain-containing protein [Elizabethkingia sp. JS20170427COW]|uniref:DUF502 domain-containing protein n=1 Tax=Elizabethkingia sp. JS20170427COW TaxID=2583851 RepID=UPI00111038D7|nr:DUF502 domain-containing protein [Elizabethkingia sp. JS20170427COW]QCX53087.1 DUF502 domain-containing protein [Elizabethkingia sp. JS20170427COW]
MKKTNYLGLFFRSLLQGLVIIGPLGATFGIIWYLISSIDSLIPSISERFPGLVFFSVILSTAAIGFLGTKFFLGRFLVDAMDNLLEHTPGIKYIYTSLKDVMSSFVGDKKKFSNPVWVKTNQNPEIWRIGFVTQSDLTPVGLQGKIAVYLPHSYAISGWVIFTDAENLLPVEKMNAVEAMKFAVSGGVSGFHPEEGKHNS